MAELSPTRKRIALMIVIIGTGLIVQRVIAFGGEGAGSVGGDPGPVDEVVTQTAVPDKSEPDEAPAPLLRLDRLEARRALMAETPPVDPLFAPLSWQPPKPKPVPAPPPPPPKPVAPPFPYPYIGGLWEEGVRTGFFTRGERVLAVRAGDTVDAAYRIEQINDMQMTLTYLPLEQSLTVVFGAPR